MADIYEILTKICSGLKAPLAECGFSPVYPDGVEKGQLPATVDSGRIVISYKGENRALRLEHFNGRLSMTGVLKEGEILDSDYAQISLTLLDPETADDKDVKYTVNEFSETLSERFGSGAEKKIKKQKLPPTVSKNAVQNGSVSYDINTLASRFTTLYPDLRAQYKENYEKYGEFLADEFFCEYGNKAVVDTINRNNPQEMKKLFNLLNEIYLDGTNDTQSLIVVTIMGALNNDQELLARCVDYICPDMLSPVIQVNKFLASSKSARLRLENPPKYKPKKKKQSLGSRIGQG